MVISFYKKILIPFYILFRLLGAYNDKFIFDLILN